MTHKSRYVNSNMMHKRRGALCLKGASIMDENFHIYMYGRRLSKVERNRPGMEDRFYEEYGGGAFDRLADAFCAAAIFPFRVVGFLLALIRTKKHRPLTDRCKELTPRIARQ
jgi:hypothetical protein